jgi:predicted secreted protein
MEISFMRTSSPLRALVLVLVLALAFGSAHAQQQLLPSPSGVLSLSASATIEAPKDLMSVVFTVTRDGTDSGAVQTQIKQALDAALAEARRIAKPGQVDVQTGAFSLSPRYSQKGVINGWQGTAELRVEGRDMPAIAQLAGKISTMTVNRVDYGIARETREKLGQDAAAQAIAAFRAQAASASKLFGYTDYTVREVNVSTSEQVPMPYRAEATMAMAKSADASPLPVEAGKGTVTAAVSGAVQMR